MTDILSYRQLFDELERLNTSAYDFLAEGDFEAFKGITDDFMASGITEQENFPSARAAYRWSSMPFTLNHAWIGPDSRNLLNDYIFHDIAEGWTIHDLNQRDVFPVYAYMARRIGPDPLALTEEEKEQERQERLENRLAAERCAAFDDFINRYRHLYDPVSTQPDLFSVPLTDDPDTQKMQYISRVSGLAKARSRFHLTFDFSCTTVNGSDLTEKTIPEMIALLTEKLPDLYHKNTGRIRTDIQDYLTFSSRDQKLLAGNYLQGKGIPRKNWKNYCRGKMPDWNFFYLELAFYLNIPSSDEIEKFMNLHGYSLKSPMTLFYDVSWGQKRYYILHRDLCRWIDAGIDYNLINSICRLELEEKEIRKPKAV